MSNRTAAILAVLLTCLILADVLFNDSFIVVFLGRKLLNLIEWMAFWR